MQHPARVPVVLQVGSLPPPPGGIGSYLDGLLRSPAAAGYRHEVFDVGVAPVYRQHRVLRLWLSGRFLGGLALRLRRSPPDLVHVHAAEFPGFWEKAVFVAMASRHGIPCILHLHGGAFDRALERLTGRRARWVAGTFARAAAVVTTNARWLPLLERIAPAGRFVILPNAIHLGEFAPVTVRPQRTRVRILVIAMLSARKGIDDLLTAVQHLVQEGCTAFELDVVGGDERHGALQHYAAASRAAGLGTWVRFRGEQVGGAKLRFLHDADIFVLPSRSESFGIANLEAMACALPVLSTRTGGIPEYIEDGVHGTLVNPGDSRALATGLRRLIEDPALRQRLGEQARRRAAEYDWSIAGERLAALYDRCLAARVVPAG